jgi:hypothetical protein
MVWLRITGRPHLLTHGISYYNSFWLSTLLSLPAIGFGELKQWQCIIGIEIKIEVERSGEYTEASTAVGATLV